ncbi:MAG: ribonuclease III [Aquamicrobium sp.]|uniref:ribonuclease III n=1 Tax=Aquamicrobium sp. TaxID=1872579 RepID=UPI00349EDC04|nr:ribonuclease III [Aquamicrobium sp.]
MAVKSSADADLAASVEAISGLAFTDAALLRRALTHASAGEGKDYQRLEFLGDRVLGLVVAQMVFEANPGAPEGELSLRLNALVNAETLAEIADEIGLSRLIVAGSELRTLTGRKRVNLRADVMEALIAAVYLEGGLEAARRFIGRYWEGRSKAPTAARRDAKTELQEWAHQVAKASPLYVVESREGPDHDPVFEVSVRIAGVRPASARGRSKREAEQAAATAILLREGVWAGEVEG